LHDRRGGRVGPARHRRRSVCAQSRESAIQWQSLTEGTSQSGGSSDSITFFYCSEHSKKRTGLRDLGWL
jgi:hypothetical protein